MDALYDWMMTTWVNRVVLGYSWSWPTLETLHFLGACLLVGALLRRPGLLFRSSDAA